MAGLFEEIAHERTSIGEVVLQRRCMLEKGGIDVFELKLGDEYLMSSLFTAGEIALSHLGLDALGTPSAPLNVVVGGLGLGYTAEAVLHHQSVGSLLVVEFLGPVIDWHAGGLVPMGSRVPDDPRCRIIHGDFFKMAQDPGTGFDPAELGRRFDAILLDVDHSPTRHLSGYRGGFYEPDGIMRMSGNLKAGGVFALWSDDEPEEEFLNVLDEVFDEVHGEVVTFPNPLAERMETNGIYIGRLSG